MKKVTGQVKLQCPGGEAKPGPPIGPVLGANGVNIPMFIKEFNARTAEMKGYVVPVVITVFSDKSFTFITKTPPTSILLAKAAGVDKGSAKPNRDKVGKVLWSDMNRELRRPMSGTSRPDGSMSLMPVGASGR